MIALTSCVERKLFIRTEPPGATAYMDGRRLGTTPVEVPFTYYGTHEFLFRKKDHDDLRVLRRIPEPLYQVFPLDFVCENLVPATITDRQEVSAVLGRSEPRHYDQGDVNRAIEKARALRSRLNEAPSR